ncbi:AI-2E family transporter [Lutibacter sp. HS1-25]|uniref:AI-2E family transporter n=1 Tax=Lutibacter sp. HS1-25 TaxID=2485000 RepID=UPI0010118502|nr:AI-2E family transporter [Lutibacter sp. HS1-25]RXP44777.1 AI-2E family transporter [Lutibacter sp. HS1-25]
MNKKITSINHTPIVLIIASFVIIIAGIMNAVSLINALLMGLFISIVCAQPINWLQSKKVPKSLALLIVLIGITVVFIFFIEVIGSSLSSFSQNVDVYEANLKKMSENLFLNLESRGFNVSFKNITNLVDVSKAMNITANLLSKLGGFMGNALTIFFLTIFLLLELDSISIKTKIIYQDSKKSSSYFSVIIKNIRHYLTIKTMTSALTGVLIWIPLYIIDLDYAIIWALIAFLLNFIPNFGSIIAAIPAILFALIQQGFDGVFWTVSIFLVVNMIVGNFVEPKVMGRGLGLSTYVVFVSLLFWGFILGTIGMFLSVPLTMAIKIMLEQNKQTQWIAILLGSSEEAIAILENKENKNVL